MQVQAELKRKVGRWRMATETVCCGQWLAVLDPWEDNFSIATVPQRNGSFVSASQPVPDCSLSPGSARILRRQQPPTSPQPHASLQHFPSELEKDNIQSHVDQDAIGLDKSQGMQVSFLIHLKDPVELLPHVVNTDSDWIQPCVHCTFHFRWIVNELVLI